MANSNSYKRNRRKALSAFFGTLGVAAIIAALGTGLAYGLKESNSTQTIKENNTSILVSNPQKTKYIFQNADTPTFNVSAKSSNANDYLTYQWYAGTGSSKLIIPNMIYDSYKPSQTDADNLTSTPLTYSCVITAHNHKGLNVTSTTLEFSLYVISKPTISFSNASYATNTVALYSNLGTNNVVYATLNETSYQTIISNATCSDSSIGLTYQWYKSSSNKITSISQFTSSNLIKGATSSSYTLQNSDVNQIGTTYYYLYASGVDQGNDFSNLSPAYEVQVTKEGTISVQYSTTPVYQTVGYAGSTISGNVTNSGNNLTNDNYQWYSTNPYYDTNASKTIDNKTYYEIPGATNQYYNLSTNDSTASGTYYYALVVSSTQNGLNIISTNINTPQEVVVSSKPTISITDSNNFSVSGTLYQDNGIILNPTVSVSGVSTTAKDQIGFTYQWYSNTIDSNSGGTKITASGTGSSYYLESSQLNEANLYYYVVVTYNVPYTNGDTLTQTSSVYHITLTTSTTPTPTVSNITNTVYAINGETQYQTLVSSISSVANSSSTYQWYTTNPYYSSNASLNLQDGTKVYLIPDATDTTYTLNSNDLILPKNQISTDYKYYLQQTTTSRINEAAATTIWSSAITVYVSENPTIAWAGSYSSTTINATLDQTNNIYQTVSAEITNANSSINTFNNNNIIYSWYEVSSNHFTLPTDATALQASSSSTFNYLPYTKTAGTYYFVCIASYSIDGITVQTSQFNTTLVVSNAPTITINSTGAVNQEVYVNQTNTKSIFTVNATLSNNSTIGFTYTWYQFHSSTNAAPSSLPKWDETTNALTLPTGWAKIENNNQASYEVSSYPDVGTYYYVVLVQGTVDGISLNSISSSTMSLKVYDTPSYTTSITSLTSQSGLTISKSSSTSASVYTNYSNPIGLNVTQQFSGFINSSNYNVVTTYSWYEKITTSDGKTTTTNLVQNQSFSNYVITSSFTQANATYEFYCELNSTIYTANGQVALVLNQVTSSSYVFTVTNLTINSGVNNISSVTIPTSEQVVQNQTTPIYLYPTITTNSNPLQAIISYKWVQLEASVTTLDSNAEIPSSDIVKTAGDSFNLELDSTYFTSATSIKFALQIKINYDGSVIYLVSNISTLYVIATSSLDPTNSSSTLNPTNSNSPYNSNSANAGKYDSTPLISGDTNGPKVSDVPYVTVTVPSQTIQVLEGQTSNLPVLNADTNISGNSANYNVSIAYLWSPSSTAPTSFSGAQTNAYKALTDTISQNAGSTTYYLYYQVTENGVVIYGAKASGTYTIDVKKGTFSVVALSNVSTAYQNQTTGLTLYADVSNPNNASLTYSWEYATNGSTNFSPIPSEYIGSSNVKPPFITLNKTIFAITSLTSLNFELVVSAASVNGATIYASGTNADGSISSATSNKVIVDFTPITVSSLQQAISATITYNKNSYSYLSSSSTTASTIVPIINWSGLSGNTYTISYQWYSSTSSAVPSSDLANPAGGTSIAKATNYTYIPNITSAVTTYYYLVVKLEVNGVTSYYTSKTSVEVQVFDPSTISPSASNGTLPYFGAYTPETKTLDVYKYNISQSGTVYTNNFLSPSIAPTITTPTSSINVASIVYQWSATNARGTAITLTNSTNEFTYVLTNSDLATTGKYIYTLNAYLVIDGTKEATPLKVVTYTVDVTAPTITLSASPYSQNISITENSTNTYILDPSISTSLVPVSYTWYESQSGDETSVSSLGKSISSDAYYKVPTNQTEGTYYYYVVATYSNSVLGYETSSNLLKYTVTITNASSTLNISASLTKYSIDVIQNQSDSLTITPTISGSLANVTDLQYSWSIASNNTSLTNTTLANDLSFSTNTPTLTIDSEAFSELGSFTLAFTITGQYDGSSFTITNFANKEALTINVISATDAKIPSVNVTLNGTNSSSSPLYIMNSNNEMYLTSSTTIPSSNYIITVAYQWYTNGTTTANEVSGATNSYFLVSNLTTETTYYLGYKIYVNGVVQTSNFIIAIGSVTLAPYEPVLNINSSKTDYTYYINGQDNHVQQSNLPDLSVSVTGNTNTGTITYKWYSGTYNANDTNGGGTLISGATSKSYQISVTSTQTSIPNYYVIVSTTINGKTITAYKQFSLTSYTINPTLVWNNQYVANNSVIIYTSVTNNLKLDTLIYNLPYFISNPNITYVWTQTYTDSSNETTTTQLKDNTASYTLPTYTNAGIYTYSVQATFSFYGMKFTLTTSPAITVSVNSLSNIKITLPSSNNYIQGQTSVTSEGQNQTLNIVPTIDGLTSLPSDSTFTYQWYQASNNTASEISNNDTSNPSIYAVNTTNAESFSIYLKLIITINGAPPISITSNTATVNVYSISDIEPTLTTTQSYGTSYKVILKGQQYRLPQVSANVDFSSISSIPGLQISNVTYQWYSQIGSASSYSPISTNGNNSWYNLISSDASSVGTDNFYVLVSYEINGVNFTISSESSPESINVSEVSWKATPMNNNTVGGYSTDPVIYWAPSDNFNVDNYSSYSPGYLSDNTSVTNSYSLYDKQTSNLPMFATTIYAVSSSSPAIPLPVVYLWTFNITSSSGASVYSKTLPYQKSQSGLMLPYDVYSQLGVGDTLTVSLKAEVGSTDPSAPPALGYFLATSSETATNTISFKVSEVPLSITATPTASSSTIYYKTNADGTRVFQTSNLPTIYMQPTIKLDGNTINTATSGVSVSYGWFVTSSGNTISNSYSYYQLTSDFLSNAIITGSTLEVSCTITATYEGIPVSQTFNVTFDLSQVYSSSLVQVTGTMEGEQTTANQYEAQFQTFGVEYMNSGSSGAITYQWYKSNSYDSSKPDDIPTTATLLSTNSNYYTLNSDDVSSAGTWYYWLKATLTADGVNVSQTQLFTITINPYQTLTATANAYSQTIYAGSNANNTLSAKIYVYANGSLVSNSAYSIENDITASWYVIPSGTTVPSVNSQDLGTNNGQTINNLPSDTYLVGTGLSFEIPAKYINNVGMYNFYLIVKGTVNGYSAYDVLPFPINVVENNTVASYISSSNSGQTAIKVYNNQTSNLPTLTDNILNLSTSKSISDFSYEWYYILNGETSQNSISITTSSIDLSSYLTNNSSFSTLLSKGGWIYCVATGSLNNVPMTTVSSFEVIPYTLSASITYQYSTSDGALYLYLGQTQNLPSLAPTITTTVTNEITGTTSSWNGSLSYQWYEDGNIITTKDNQTANSSIYTFNSTYDLTGSPWTNYYSVLVSATINGNTFSISPSISSTTGSILHTIDTPTITVTNNNNESDNLNYYFVKNQSINIPLLTASSQASTLSVYSLNTHNDYYNISSYEWTVINTTTSTTNTYSTDSPSFNISDSSYNILNTVGTYKIYLTVTYNFYGVSASGSSETSPFIVTVSQAPTIALTTNTNQTVDYQSLFEIGATVTIDGTSSTNYANEYTYEVQEYNLNNNITSISDFATFAQSSLFTWTTVQSGTLVFSANDKTSTSNATIDYQAILGNDALPLNQFRIIVTQNSNSTNQVTSSTTSVTVTYPNSTIAQDNLNNLMSNAVYDLGMIDAYASANSTSENSLINLLMPQYDSYKIWGYSINDVWDATLNSIKYVNDSSTLFPTFLVTYTNNSEQTFTVADPSYNDGKSTITIPVGATISFDLPMTFLLPSVSFTNLSNQTATITQAISITSSNTSLSWAKPSVSLNNANLIYNIVYNGTQLVPNNPYWQFPNLQDIIFTNSNTTTTSNDVSWSWIPLYSIK